MDLRPLGKDFYLRSPLVVALSLLGKLLVRELAGTRLIVRITETEAYVGTDDDACHASRGKTKRNASMWLEGGHAYVYFTYGMHHCLNIVVGPQGFPAAVLIRSGEPIEGIGTMVRNRGLGPLFSKLGHEVVKRKLTCGPAMLCQALSIDKSLNGKDLFGPELWLAELPSERKLDVVCTSRVGVDYATRCRHLPWRFYIADSPFVSRVV